MNSIFTRRSIRSFTDKPVSQEDIRYILKAAMAAPSAKNTQPWRFIVIDDRKILDEIPNFHPYSKMLHEAPVAIAVCADTVGSYKGMWVQDCAAATQNMLLAAESKGLGSVWLGVYPTDLVDSVKDLLKTPDNIVPFSIVALGHKVAEKQPNDRYDEEKVHYNSWS